MFFKCLGFCVSALFKIAFLAAWIPSTFVAFVEKEKGDKDNDKGEVEGGQSRRGGGGIRGCREVGV
eukprot:9405912-Pyramimonas_sp.AAC.1